MCSFIFQDLGNKVAIGISGENEEEIKTWHNWFYNFKACDNDLMWESDVFAYFETDKTQFLKGLFNAIQMRLCRKYDLDLEGKFARKKVFKKVRDELDKFKKEFFLNMNRRSFGEFQFNVPGDKKEIEKEEREPVTA